MFIFRGMFVLVEEKNYKGLIIIYYYLRRDNIVYERNIYY